MPTITTITPLIIDGNDEKHDMTESPTDMNDVHEQGPSSEGDGDGEEEGDDDEEDRRGSSDEEASADEAEAEGEEEEEEDGEEEEEEEEEDDEPALKYERIGGAIPDLLKKDSGSALAVSKKYMALGTHAGFVHLLDLTGKRTKSYKPHLASVVDICVDETGDFIATASMDGQVVIISLSSKESYAFDLRRPMRTVALEPNFAKRSTRSFVCGGQAGTLVLREKGWLGHNETTLHLGEGPIWQVRWRERLIAWANDLGVKIYDTVSQSRITFIDRPAESPRADLFKCTLHWQDDSTLLIAWADHIKVARIRARPRTTTTSESANLPPLLVEITAVFQLDCMIAGIVPHPNPPSSTVPESHRPASIASQSTSDGAASLAKKSSSSLTSFLIVAYSPPDTSFLDEMTEDRAKQARKAADRPELRIISRAGEELAADALSLTNFQAWGCNDYVLAEVDGEDELAAKLNLGSGVDGPGRCYIVLSPKDLILVKPRDRLDHVSWLVERMRYEEALEAIEEIEASGGELPDVKIDGVGINASDIGQRYVEYLVSQGDFSKAARLCPKVCARDPKRWEHWIFVFAEKRHLQAIIPYVPTENPRLGHLVYEMMLAYFLAHDREMLLQTVKEWPRDIYDIAAVIVAVQAELDKTASSSSKLTSSSPTSSPDSVILMGTLAELYIANRQPGKALPFFLRLRRPNVFDLIRENNLFTDVKDQVLLLVEFDLELMEKRRKEGDVVDERESEAIKLLVDNVHSIPIGRVVQQLESRPKYLFLYLDALVGKDPNLVSGFTDLQDLQVKLYADFAQPRLIDFLRANTDYDLEKAYKVCQERDLIPEMVFLLGRVGDNKKALKLIIERLGDVNRAIDFAKDQADDDLWEDLLKYSETRPAFIRGLLENVGPEINPIRLIRRIKNGLEIPGLKGALIKILQDFNLQISLLEGCHTILDGDCSDLSRRLQRDQTGGFFITAKSSCQICSRTLQESPQGLVLLFLCRHTVHASCVSGCEDLPHQPDPILRGIGMAGPSGRGLSGKIAFESMVRARIARGCPVCYKRSEGM